ncbi:unnamed protein product [Brachionus calyciflorus]|uniref:[histone H3]-dimethyl-L-lysine(36) demethylase n=1 Tax=Brachionus calyciflorus TaxID=104777 RepID=A0A814DK05_9BILA|nr:unnamed protein product [Brachionus calyciflorus]
MTRKSKSSDTSIDPVTTRLREAINSAESNNNQNKVLLNDTNRHDEISEESKRKKRRKSTPNLIKSLNKSKYVESETDDEYLNFCSFNENFINDTNDLNNNNINTDLNLIDENYFQDDGLTNSMYKDDEDSLFDDQRKWNLDEKLNIISKYNSNFVKYLETKEFDFTYVQENGFDAPLVFLDKSGLGMRVPSENFRVSDVKSCVGSKRIIDVVDVNTQKGLTMSMKDWCEYYDSPNRDRLLNVISLEFSHTKLENYVEAPLVVRQLDWIETAWPRHLRESHTESTNLIDKMKYPKVQKYVLMSVAGCYTDFHIDMGGTSVWYHVLKGEKIFWLIPPTEKNLKTYEKWILSGNQSKVFLPDLMDECQRIVLKQGSTFMLPSGWIHGVYTSKDSLVFGGNFLHSFNAKMQLKVYNIESKTKVPQQYRYPFFLEIIWFALERYVHCLTGVTHMDDYNESNNPNEIDLRSAYKTFQPDENLSLNRFELEALQVLYDFVINLNENKRCVPKEIVQANLLLKSIKVILDDHNNKISIETNHQINGIPFMHWPKPDRKFMKKMENDLKKRELDYYSNLNSVQSYESKEDYEYNAQSPDNFDSNNHFSNGIVSSEFGQGFSDLMNNQFGNNSRKHVMRNMPRTKGSIKKRLRPQNIPRSNVERRRRVRCHNCEPCTRDDCGDCKYCKDMKKFGGTGISKQCCLAKQCLQPLLPTTTTCMLCDVLIDRFQTDKANIMYECEICFEIYHVQCFKRQYPDLDYVEPIINEDLVNCWKCPNCVNKGFINSNCFKQDMNKQAQFENSNGSNSLNDSFNNIINNVISSSVSSNSNLKNQSNSPIDFVLSPPSTSTSYLSSALTSVHPTKPKSKRHRRTKQEMEMARVQSINYSAKKENINSNLKRKRKNETISPEDNDESIISLDSLTYFEKQIILREFCEVITKPSEKDLAQLNRQQNMMINNKISIPKLIATESGSKISSNSANSNSDHETIIVDTDDSDSRDFDLEDDIQEKSLGLRPVVTTKNVNLNVKGNFSNFDFDPNNEHIYHDDD